MTLLNNSHPRHFYPLIILTVLLIFIICKPGYSADFYVDDDGSNLNDGLSSLTPWKTINYAVNQVKKTPPGNVIHVAAGHYNAANGDVFPLTFIPLYGTTGISLQGAGRDVTILDSTGYDDRVVFIDRCQDIYVRGFTITGAYLYAGAGALRITSSQRVEVADNIFRDNEGGAGAGMYIQGADNEDITIQNNIFRNNIATAAIADGACIFLYNSGYDTPLIKNNYFIHNRSAGGAGGIYVLNAAGVSNPTIENNVFLYNQAQWGVAVYCFFSSPTVRNNYIAYNIAYESDDAYTATGGGMLMKNSNSLVENNIFEYNHSEGTGGAISLANDSDPVIFNNVIRGNTAANMGGGIFALICGGIYKNNLIVGNTADYYNLYTPDRGGGGFCIRGSSHLYELINNTFFGNRASRIKNGSGFQTMGSAIYLQEAYAEFTNNIFAGNTNGEALAEEPSPTVPSSVILKNNDIYSNSDGNFYDAQTDTTYDLITDIESLNPGSSGNLSIDPEFVTGSGGRYYLSNKAAGDPVDSPLIDAGSGNAVDHGLSTNWTTRTDDVDDIDVADIGYHYSSTITFSTPDVLPVGRSILFILTLLTSFALLFIIRFTY